MIKPLRNGKKNTLRNTVNQIAPIAKKEANNIFKEGVQKWFNNIGFSQSSTNMMRSITTHMRTKYTKDYAVVTYETFVNEDRYDIAHTNFARNPKYTVDPFNWIINELQWGQGVLGLPEHGEVNDWINPNPHVTANPLSYFVERHYIYTWKKRLSNVLR